MKNIRASFLAKIFLITILAAPLTVSAAAFEATDLLGQVRGGSPVFTIKGANNAPNNIGLNAPRSVAVDSVNHRLFVADNNNCRILVYPLIASGTLASYVPDYVLGSADAFTIGGGCSGTGAISSTTISTPNGMAYDSENSRLFVSDEGYSRVSVFDVSTSTIRNNMPASYVLGQPDMTTHNISPGLIGVHNPRGLAYDGVHERLFVGDTGSMRVAVFDVNPGTIANGQDMVYRLGNQSLIGNVPETVSSSSVDSAYGLAYDGDNDRLFVADTTTGRRVLVFNTAAIANGMPASYVLGQPDFETSGTDLSSSTTPHPYGLAYKSNRLFVSDDESDRVLVFDVNPATIANGQSAINVIGQSNFTSNSSNISDNTLHTPSFLAYDSTNDGLFVADAGNHRVLLFNVGSISNGESAINVLGHLIDGLPAYNYSGADNGPGSDGFKSPAATIVDQNNHHLFVADNENNRILVFNLNSNNNLLDYNADYVIGQQDMYSANLANTRTGTEGPVKLAFDPNGERLFVGESGSRRVMVYDVGSGSLATGMNASHVLGQPNFTTVDVAPTTTARSFMSSGLAYDADSDYLFVSDADNNRVLVFDAATSTLYDYMPASYVLGQPDFATADTGTSSSTLSDYPAGIAYYNNRLFVADGDNYRVLVFGVSALSNGMPASYVLGQPDFETADTGVVSSSTIGYPEGISYDSKHKRLYVADSGNSRVLGFNVSTDAIRNGLPATVVLGQQNFTSSGGGTSATSLDSPAGVDYDLSNNRIYISDTSNNRVVAYDHIKINTVSLPDATVGRAYAEEIETVNDQGAVTFSLEDGSLPPGMTIGSVDGTPTEAGTYTFTIQASDSVNGAGQLFDDQEYTLVVLAGSSVARGSRPQNNPPATTWYAPTSTTPTSTTPTSTTPGDSDLEAQIQSLLAQIAALKAKLGLPSGNSNTSSLFTRDLELDSIGSDVKELQKFLNTHGFPLASTGPGSPGQETEIFGGLTKAALSKFQAANSISPAAGYFGPKTRGVVNGMLGR